MLLLLVLLLRITISIIISTKLIFCQYNEWVSDWMLQISAQRLRSEPPLILREMT